MRCLKSSRCRDFASEDFEKRSSNLKAIMQDLIFAVFFVGQHYDVASYSIVSVDQWFQFFFSFASVSSFLI